MELEFKEFDRCPGCRKKVSTMVMDRLPILSFPAGMIACPLCGCVFVTGKTRDKMIEQAKRTIFLPGEEKGLVKL